jgi:hypothetical protein
MPADRQSIELYRKLEIDSAIFGGKIEQVQARQLEKDRKDSPPLTGSQSIRIVRVRPAAVYCAIMAQKRHVAVFIEIARLTLWSRLRLVYHNEQ